MNSFSGLRFRLVGTVFLAVAPASVLLYMGNRYLITHYGVDLPWSEFMVGLLALGAAWFGGERFILRQVRMLSKAAQRVGAGDLTTRTGLSGEQGELGDLARTFDTMAASLEQRVKEREQAESTLLHRSFQQTVVAALGQFAMVSNDINALLNQAVMLAAQTLEVEFVHVLELQPGGKFLLLRAGVGWKEGCIGRVVIPADLESDAGYALLAGEPVAFESLGGEGRFRGSSLLTDHGVVSGISVAVAGHGQAFGVLGAYTAIQRKFTEDEIHFLFSLATSLAMAAERIRAETELQKLAAFAKLNPNPVMELSRDGGVTYFNDAALSLSRSLGQKHPCELLPPNAQNIVRDCLQAGRSIQDLQTLFQGRTLCWSFHPIAVSRVVHAYVEDITDRLNLEAQLLQSQKMQSIGQLAAGVAHDFNNMLTVIQGHSGMLMARTNLPPEVSDSAGAIYYAADRAATLTRQLLMFSRKNVMKPEPQDLREVVSELSKMLKRLLGETIVLEFTPPSELPLIQADRGMVEQVIMNLAVNARDAMPNGGTLAISTNSVELDDAFAQTHPEARTGLFVCMRVSDTGCGMDPATLARVFEPFFTTKEVGKGTGLGLATAYGIVKQHEGWIEVSSEVGKGSTFNAFFPASGGLRSSQGSKAAAAPVCGGQETVLVVEDELVLRDMAHLILQDCGYRVLTAASGPEALQVWEDNADAIDLVVTDVVMPGGMSGRDLARRLQDKRPGLKIIFTSGYNVEESHTEFFRRNGALFLQKPYTRPNLAKIVRECLDRPAGAA